MEIDSDNLVDLGKIYHYGRYPHKKDFKKAVKFYEEAIRLNNPHSMNHLAFMYHTGQHPRGKNITEAFELYNRAIELGNYNAMNNMGFLYLTNEHPDGKNIKMAIKYLKMAIQLGCIEAMGNLGELYIGMTGESFDEDKYLEGIELLKTSAEYGNAIAVNILSKINTNDDCDEIIHTSINCNCKKCV